MREFGQPHEVPHSCGYPEDVCDGITQNIDMEQQDGTGVSFFTRARQ